MVILFDTPSSWKSLLPFTFTRALAEIRVGILTIAEKWQRVLKQDDTYALSKLYLNQNKSFQEGNKPLLYINSSVFPNKEILYRIEQMNEGEGIKVGNEIVAFKTKKDTKDHLEIESIADKINFSSEDIEIIQLKNVWDIFLLNKKQIEADFDLICNDIKREKITDPYTKIYGKENLLVEEGATIRAGIINAENGLVFIGRNAKIQEGAIIKGSHAIANNAEVKVGAKLVGDSTLGPYCKVGGEVSNSVFFGYSNKGHDGFVGNSVIGEWCNLGADTNTSNLKNNYSNVKVWSYNEEQLQNTDQQFCGLLMGDHSKSGINTMFNTGTIVGVGANVFGAGFPDKFIPSFSWGGAEGIAEFTFEKMLATAEKMKERRNLSLTQRDKNILKEVFEITSKYRSGRVNN